MEYKVTAIVSTYNSEAFIDGCLLDLTEQTIFAKTQVIVVNSGSKQNEHDIIQRYVDKYPDNFLYIKTQNREGLYRAWNRAIAVTSGKYITNANTDDRRRKDAFEVMSCMLDNHPKIGLVYGDQRTTSIPHSTFEKCDKYDVAHNPEFTSRDMVFKGCFVGSQPMWRASLHKEFGLFDEKFVVAGDFEFWCRIAQRYAFKHIPEELGLYYKNEGGIEYSNRNLCGRETVQVLSKYRYIYSKLPKVT